MRELELTCTDDRLTLRLNDAWPELVPAEDGRYRLRCYSAEKDSVEVMLDAATLNHKGSELFEKPQP